MKNRVAWRVSWFYVAFGEGWIVLSSVLVWLQMGERSRFESLLEMAKGTAFIVITAGLLFTLLRRWEGAILGRDEQLVRSEARYRLLHESLRDGFVQIDLEGRILDCNAVYCDMLGYSRDELIARNFGELTPPRWHAREDAILKNQVHGRGYSDVYEQEYAHKNGTIFPVELRAILVRDEAGNPASIYAIVRDISERRALADRAAAMSTQLIHAGRVQELGQVSAGIAHELNQPLSAMCNYAATAKRLIDVGDASAAAQAITKAGEQARRAGDIIQRMRSFVEKRDTVRKPDNINAIIEEAAALGLIGAKASGIDTRFALEPDLPPVIADRLQIEQVLVNLLHNAIDAMAEQPQRILTLASRQRDAAVEIIVGDTGKGISDSIAHNLFQPFVTTKQNGMGIGLAISKSIVEQHGGEIIAEANPGGGTRFCVRLPAAGEG